eukprot:9476380-Pyramimonas_sp.AAC.2
MSTKRAPVRSIPAEFSPVLLFGNVAFPTTTFLTWPSKAVCLGHPIPIATNLHDPSKRQFSIWRQSVSSVPSTPRLAAMASIGGTTPPEVLHRPSDDREHVLQRVKTFTTARAHR